MKSKKNSSMVKVISPGFFTTVQDIGRFGHRELGVPVSGAMDQYSAKLANHVLGNNANDAVLEITLGNCKLSFENETLISISGAYFSPKLNDDYAPKNSMINVYKGDVLSFGKSNFGARCYLAVKGGFQSETVLNSRSFYKGITKSSMLKKNDELPLLPFNSGSEKSFSSVKVDLNHFTSQIIEAYRGPEYDLLTEEQKQLINSTSFTISKDNSRMGYRLEQLVANGLDSILTSSVMPGTVQLTPSGKLIVLMRDCQVTGGYPRILQLTESAINKLAQKTTGETFKFKSVDLNL